MIIELSPMCPRLSYRGERLVFCSERLASDGVNLSYRGLTAVSSNSPSILGPAVELRDDIRAWFLLGLAGFRGMTD